MSQIGNPPASLPPSGPAGGDLAGTYPNPTLALSISTAVAFTGLGATTIAMGGLTIPVGSLGVPSLKFAGSTSGWYQNSAGAWTFETGLNSPRVNFVGSQIIMDNAEQLGWSNGNATGNQDTRILRNSAAGSFLFDNNSTRNFILTAAAAATLQLGAAAADTTGVSQTLQAQGVLTGGTNNQAGGNLTIASGQGKGNVASSIIFQTPAVGVSGNTLQTMTTRLTLTDLVSTFNTATVTIPEAGVIKSATSGANVYLDNNTAFRAINNVYLMVDTGNAHTTDAIILGAKSVAFGSITKLAQFNENGTIQFNQFTTAGLLQNDASGNVTTLTGNLTLPGNLTFAAAKTLSISSGTNQRAGDATLVGGTVTVSNTTITANTKIVTGHKSSGGTIGTAVDYTVNAGVGFTLTSNNVLDTSTLSYMLIEVP